MDPADHDEPPAQPSDDDASGPADGGAFGFACPQCGRGLPDYSATCPHCGSELGDEFSATYHVRMPPAGRRIALAALIGLAVLVLLVLIALLSQMLATTPPPDHL